MAEGIKDMTKYAIIIGALAVIVLVLLAVVGGFTKQVRTPTLVNVTELNVSVVGTAVSLGTSYPFPQTVTSCVNNTATADSLSTAFYDIDEGTVESVGGTLTLNAAGTLWNDTEVNCSMNYLADSDGQAAGDLFITGITIFATFIGVLVLALIGMIIVKLYKKD